MCQNGYGIVSQYKQWLLLYLDLHVVYREPRTNLVLNRTRTKLMKTSLQGQSEAYTAAMQSWRTASSLFLSAIQATLDLCGYSTLVG